MSRMSHKILDRSIDHQRRGLRDLWASHLRVLVAQSQGANVTKLEAQGYERHIRKLIEIDGAINKLERVTSPAYRRERERNRDGPFVTQYDQLEKR